MSSSRYTYDIERQNGYRWASEDQCHTEEAALIIAHQCLSEAWCNAVRIIRNLTRPDGSVLQTEIFHQSNLNAPTSATIDDIDDAPSACQSLAQYVSFESRQLIQRLLRSHLKEFSLTATELLHNAVELQRIQDNRPLLRAAVEKIAHLQTRGSAQLVYDRKNEIYTSIDCLLQHAINLNKHIFPSFNVGYNSLMSALPDKWDGWERHYYAMTSLSRILRMIPTSSEKLLFLCNLVATEKDPNTITFLDGAIADFMNSDTVQDITDPAPSFGDAIFNMVELARGMLETDKAEARGIVTTLNTMFSRDLLPLSRRSLCQRIQNQLRSTTPLHPTDFWRGHNKIRKITTYLWENGALMGGAEMASALAHRFTLMVGHSGEFGQRMGLLTAFSTMVDRATGVRFLCEMARSREGKDQIAKMIVLFGQVYLAETLNDFCDPSLPVKDRMQHATNAYHAMRDSSFPDAIKLQVTAHIDELLLRFIIDEKILDRIYRLDLPLRECARQLVLFGGSNTLPRGKAWTHVCQYILEQISQVDFKIKFTDGLLQKEIADKALSDFYALVDASIFTNQSQYH